MLVGFFFCMVRSSFGDKEGDAHPLEQQNESSDCARFPPAATLDRPEEEDSYPRLAPACSSGGNIQYSYPGRLGKCFAQCRLLRRVTRPQCSYLELFTNRDLATSKLSVTARIAAISKDFSSNVALSNASGDLGVMNELWMKSCKHSGILNAESFCDLASKQAERTSVFFVGDSINRIMTSDYCNGSKVESFAQAGIFSYICNSGSNCAEGVCRKDGGGTVGFIHLYQLDQSISIDNFIAFIAI
jgi:hypothetical protein